MESPWDVVRKTGGVRDPPAPEPGELADLRAECLRLERTIERIKRLVHWRLSTSRDNWPHRREAHYRLHRLLAILFRSQPDAPNQKVPGAVPSDAAPQDLAASSKEPLRLLERREKLRAQYDAALASHQRMGKLWFAFSRWRRCAQVWSEELVAILEFSAAELAEMSVAPEFKPKKPSLLARTTAQSVALWRKTADATVRMTSATVRMTTKSVEFWKARWRRKHRRKNKT